MSIVLPEFEFVDRASETIRYLEHGWPSDLCRWHSHPEYELHLIVSTQGKAFVGDYIGNFQPGTLYLTGPNLPHNWVTDEVGSSETVDLRDMLVQFSQESVDLLGEGFTEFGEMAQMFEMAAAGIEFTGFNPTFARGHFEAIRDCKGAERIVAFLRFLVRINEHAEKKRLSVANISYPDFRRHPTGIAEVVDHITKNFADELSLEQASAMAGMSPTAFSRKFQRYTGHRFVEFVNRVRIGQACAMLQATDAQVASICFDIGFQNLANFNRHFLKMKHMTPTAYRELTRAELARRPRAV